MRTRIVIASVLLLALLTITVPAAVQPVRACYEGCTPGFWKQEQHFQYWPTQICVDTNPAEPNWTYYWPLSQCSGTIVNLGAQPWNFPLQELFAIPANSCLLTGGLLDLNGNGVADTLLDALYYQGGETVQGKGQILFRAAVAGVLNGMTMLHQPPGPIIVKTNAALAKGCSIDAVNTMMYWATDFDRQNNQYCTFSP